MPNNTSSPIDLPDNKTESSPHFPVQAVIRFTFISLLFPVALFLAAGRLDWIMGWIWVGLSLAVSIVSRLIVKRRHPDLLLERARALEAEDVKPWDRLLVMIIAVYGPLIIWTLAGLDHRFAWPPDVPLAWQLVALVLILLGSFLGTWAMAVNRYFSSHVRIQKDRGQTVVTTGPYRFVRHPGYSSSLIGYLALPVMLDALWAWIPAVVTLMVVVVRTALEDRTLREELPGYREYARHTRYRLVPGIW